MFVDYNYSIIQKLDLCKIHNGIVSKWTSVTCTRIYEKH